MLEGEPHIVPVECPDCSLRTFVRWKEVRARKRHSRRCTKLPASACLNVPEFENCIHERACVVRTELLGGPAEPERGRLNDNAATAGMRF